MPRPLRGGTVPASWWLIQGGCLLIIWGAARLRDEWYRATGQLEGAGGSGPDGGEPAPAPEVYVEPPAPSANPTAVLEGLKAS